MCFDRTERQKGDTLLTLTKSSVESAKKSYRKIMTQQESLITKPRQQEMQQKCPQNMNTNKELQQERVH